MTREEAIETLKENFCAMCAYGSQNMMSCDIRGCDNRDAIKALELEYCGDAISRQAVTDTICDGISCNECSFNTCEDGRPGCLLQERVEKLPPVTPQYTDAEIQKMQELEQAEIQKAYELGKASQPKTGHWIRWYEQKEYDWGIDHIPHCKCSECGKEYDPHSSQFIKYCCECGVKMTESEDKE